MQSYVSNTGSGSTNALASRVSDAAAMSETVQFGDPPEVDTDGMSEDHFSASVGSIIADAVDFAGASVVGVARHPEHISEGLAVHPSCPVL